MHLLAHHPSLNIKLFKNPYVILTILNLNFSKAPKIVGVSVANMAMLALLSNTFNETWSQGQLFFPFGQGRNLKPLKRNKFMNNYSIFQKKSFF
jgi:hypothetical protein